MMPPTSTPDATGTVLAGRYELCAVIGRGGHGLVWHANDRATGRAVAVKMLNEVSAQDPQIIERLRREQQALVALAGTSAVGFVDLCRTAGGKLCLVMELLEGIDLEQRLEHLEAEGEQMSVAELLAVLAPVVDTLERAHEAGILHRDLKPANVFIMSPAAGGGVRLLDFGLARLRSAAPLTAAGMIVGSPSYIAPEVWKGRPEGLDQRVDVYSFGVAVFRALSNRLPFEGVTLKDKFQLTTTAPRPSLRAFRSDLPPDVDDWVQEVLAIDPDERFNGIRGAWNALLGAIRTPERGGMWALSPSAALPSVNEWAPEPEPERAPEPREAPPPPSLRPVSSGGGAVMIAPVVAVLGDPSQLADDKKSFVREWLAGSELEPSADPADVASWLGVVEEDPSTVTELRRPARKAPRPPSKPKPEKQKSKPKPRSKAKAKAKAKRKPKPRGRARKA